MDMNILLPVHHINSPLKKQQLRLHLVFSATYKELTYQRPEEDNKFVETLV